MFLTWALLFLLLCIPPMANAESKVQLNMEQLRSIGDDPEIDSPSEGVVSEVIWKGNVLCSIILEPSYLYLLIRAIRMLSRL